MVMVDKQGIVLHEKIRIGISACCMGSPVRYNGKGFDVLQVLGREKSDFVWCPVCPECMAGLGVPRDPIHVSGGDGSMVWTGEAEVKNRGGRRVADMLKAGSTACMEALQRGGVTAYVYMDGSPTCGVYRTSLKKQKRGNPPGVFGAILLQNEFFLIPSADIQSPIKWWDWRRRLLAFHWFKTVPLNTINDIYAVWYKLKFLCQELDNTWAREMGRTLAALDRHVSEEFINRFRAELLDVLRKPSTVKRITNSLWKSYSHYRKVSGKRVDEINSPEFQRNVTTIAKELLLMERTSINDSMLFGASPVIYRDKRRMPKVADEENMIEEPTQAEEALSQ
jgi:uncharacterized protein YbbK (DUF523 family)